MATHKKYAIFVVILMLFGIAYYVSPILWGIICTITLALVVQAFTIIPQDPPYVALVKFMDKFNGEVKEPGWAFFWLKGFLYSFSLIDVRDVGMNFEPQTIRTPDRAQITIDAQVIFAPAYSMSEEDKKVYHDEKDRPGIFLKNYIYKGGADGVLGIFMKTYKARVREYFQKDNEGPRTWQEAIQSGETAVLAMVRALNGDKIFGAHTEAVLDFERQHNVPSTSLYKYFLKRVPNTREKEIFGKNWEKLEAILENEIASEKKKSLKNAFLDLHDNLEKLRQGEGGVIIPDLGIRIKRLTFPNIDVIGKTAEAAEKQAKEIQERLGEKEEIEFVFSEAQKRAKEMVNDGINPEVAYKQALETIMVERGKATKDIREYQLAINGNAGQAIENLARILPHILDKLPSTGEKK